MPGNPKRTRANPASFLNQLDRNLTAAQRDLEAQERLVRGLQAARESVASVILTDASVDRPHRRQNRFNGSGSRVQMVKTMLENADGPVTVDDILTEMSKHGHPDDKRLIHSTLSYLKRTGQVKNPQRGQWTIAKSKSKQSVAA